jgi:hypothetical protein
MGNKFKVNQYETSIGTDQGTTKGIMEQIFSRLEKMGQVVYGLFKANG